MVLAIPLLLTGSVPAILAVDFYFWRKRHKAAQGLGWLDTSESLGSSASQPSTAITGWFDQIFEKQFIFIYKIYMWLLNIFN
jgi:hypothetical protein